MRILLSALVGAAGLLTGVTRADVITDWNDIAVPLIRNAPNVTATRQLALVHVAQFEAVNAVAGKYASYVANVAAPSASAEAAAAQAAHDMLLHLYPTNQAALDSALVTSLANVADGQAKSDGITLGSAVSAQVWNLRGSDGASLTVSNAFPGGPGLWSPTPSGALVPVSQQYAYVTPWVLRSASQFRPGPPPALSSAQWAADFNEMKSLGATNSTTRTAEQTDIGLFIIEFPFFLLNNAAKQAMGSQAFDTGGFSPLVRPNAYGVGGRRHRRLGWKVRLQFLAPSHGRSSSGHGWQ
jgi:hypothetical protein